MLVKLSKLFGNNKWLYIRVSFQMPYGLYTNFRVLKKTNFLGFLNFYHKNVYTLVLDGY
jgi:hypothetical protein